MAMIAQEDALVSNKTLEINRRTLMTLLASGAAVGAAGAYVARPGFAAAKKKVIGWSVAYFDHPVYQLMMKAAQELADKDGVQVIFADGKNDPSVQASQLTNFIAQNVDGIILTPAVSDPMIPAIKQVNRARIPFILVDRRIDPHNSGIHWVAMVSWDMPKSGTIGGEQVVKALNGEGNLVIIEGTPGAGSTIDRGNAFDAVIKKYPGIKVIARLPADFNRAKGQEVVEDVLQRFPKGQINAMYFMADEMLFGGLQAIEAAGRLHEFTIVSCDGEKEALDLLRKGYFDHDCIFHPDDQAVAVNIMAAVVKGQKPDLANQVWDRRKMDLLEWKGMPWVRPSCFGVDKSNAFLPENQGW
jgi:ABC-type sugar transport system substrate-binding protein